MKKISELTANAVENNTDPIIKEYDEIKIKSIVEKLDWEKMWGMIPVIAQDVETWEILMQAYANKLAVEKTLKTWKATYWSRSRNELWEKWLTSWSSQDVYEIITDCDWDAIIYKIKQLWNPAVACHTGERSCFFNSLAILREKTSENIWNILNNNIWDVLTWLNETLKTRKSDLEQ